MPKKAPIIIGNWKMYKTAQDAEEFISALKPQIDACNARVMLAVPFTALDASKCASKNCKLVIGAQNMHDAEEGAFTGGDLCEDAERCGRSVCSSWPF